MGHAWASLWDMEKYVWGVEQNEPKILAPFPHSISTGVIHHPSGSTRRGLSNKEKNEVSSFTRSKSYDGGPKI